jgi:hypothetical protein
VVADDLSVNDLTLLLEEFVLGDLLESLPDVD